VQCTRAGFLKRTSFTELHGSTALHDVREISVVTGKNSGAPVQQARPQMGRTRRRYQ
jgi:hypothetical protein